MAERGAREGGRERQGEGGEGTRPDEGEDQKSLCLHVPSCYGT